jgi:exopolysaccharide biosynthesis protein
MQRSEQRKLNQATIERIIPLVDSTRRMLSYRQAVAALNAEGYQTSRGQPKKKPLPRK